MSHSYIPDELEFSNELPAFFEEDPKAFRRSFDEDPNALYRKQLELRKAAEAAWLEKLRRVAETEDQDRRLDDWEPILGIKSDPESEYLLGMKARAKELELEVLKFDRRVLVAGALSKSAYETALRLIEDYKPQAG